MNFRKNREMRGLLVYEETTEPKAKVKKVSEKTATSPKPKAAKKEKIAPPVENETPQNTEGGKEPQADTIINQ